ncbi:efflux transporter, RND family, MFP subunit [Rickettsia endosymbiont of Ixodes pacificus]|nr:efflux transporter, RND family, MFP subunit [Rickettsia endosymbiont of Ixodes pacificus]
MIITAPYSGKIGVIKSMVGDEVKIGDYLFSITGTENSQSIFTGVFKRKSWSRY